MYDAKLPVWYTQLMDDAFGWARPDKWIAALLLPLDCVPIYSAGSSFKSWLLIKALGPLLVVFLIALASTTAHCARNGWTLSNLYAGSLSAVPLTLVTSFAFVPGVSISIFQSWLCVSYEFDGRDVDSISAHSYLRHDLRVRCSEGASSSPEHETIKEIALVFVFIWPVGVAVAGVQPASCNSNLINVQSWTAPPSHDTPPR